MRQAMSIIEAAANQKTFGRAGYESRATLSKYDNVTAIEGNGAWFDYIDRRALVAVSRQFLRDNPIYQGIITQAVNYVIGAEGFQLQCRSKNAKWNAQCEAFWKSWIRRCDTSGYYDGMPLERVLFPELLVTGECCMIPQDDGTIQIIESEQLTSNGYNDGDGVVVNERQQPVKFSICPYNRAGIDRSAMIEFDADQVLFCALKDRPSSVRGMPRLQASFPMLHRMNSVLDSEVQAWFMQSCIALSVLTENAATLNPDDPSTDSNDFNVTKFDYGMVFQANPGDKIEGLARTAPNRDLSTASATLLRFVGLPLGLPLELVLLDWTKSNFSQSRAVMQQLSLNFGTLQALVIHKIMEPVYRWRINLAMERGELPRNNGWQKIEFVAPPFPMLDPEKESVAFGHQIDRALTTQSRMLKSLGYDREEMITERQEEIGDCMRRASELEAQYGQKVPWEILYGMNANPAYNADAQQDEKALTTQTQPEEPDEALPV